MKIKNLAFILLNLMLLQSVSFAEIRLPSIINSNMVIQQNTNIPIWGWADPGEKININADWLKRDTSIIANEKGEWMVKLKSPAAGGPFTITLTGKNEIVLDNVLSGEVWFASGQSNMAMALERCNNAEEEIATANYPEIRLFHVERTSASELQSDCRGTWQETTPESAKDFSGVAYFFARKIYKQLNVPIGVISANKGGSLAEAWMPVKVIESDAELSLIFDMWRKIELAYPEAERKYSKELDVWQNEKELAQLTGIPQPPKPAMSNTVHMMSREHKRPGALYNAMVAPIIPFAIKGAIWYQGESNVDRPIQYRKLFQSLLTNWWEEWDIGEFPFYFVQIAPFRYNENLENASLLREAQMMALSLPNTGMIVTTDVGNIDDIHPKNKQDVGKRLALMALANTYGFDDLVFSGPLYKFMEIEENNIRLHFDNTGSGLICNTDSLTDFEIAGSNKKFIKARAIIDGKTLVVYSDEIINPIAVRFGWSIISVPNFFNKEGLPAAPFRTVEWD